MELKVDSLKCTGCRICEFACNYHQDESISPIGSSMMFYFEEKKNYYGMMVKREKTLYLRNLLILNLLLLYDTSSVFKAAMIWRSAAAKANLSRSARETQA